MRAGAPSSRSPSSPQALSSVRLACSRLLMLANQHLHSLSLHRLFSSSRLLAVRQALLAAHCQLLARQGLPAAAELSQPAACRSCWPVREGHRQADWGRHQVLDGPCERQAYKDLRH